jgi:hypothetical protein
MHHYPSWILFILWLVVLRCKCINVPRVAPLYVIGPILFVSCRSGCDIREMHSSSSLEQIGTGKVLDNENMTYI